MKININPSGRTGTIKQQFNKAFPFLKIEFFSIPHIAGEPSKKNLLTEDKLLSEINPGVKKGTVYIEPGNSVAEFEEVFQKEFGLPVQVFRNQKGVWLETTKTDHQTLAEQNERGKNISTPEAHFILGDRYFEDGQY